MSILPQLESEAREMDGKPGITLAQLVIHYYDILKENRSQLAVNILKPSTISVYHAMVYKAHHDLRNPSCNNHDHNRLAKRMLIASEKMAKLMSQAATLATNGKTKELVNILNTASFQFRVLADEIKKEQTSCQQQPTN